MSPSVLHRRFKAATVMSPLQYQKQVRLLEARKMLMSGDVEAAAGGGAAIVGFLIRPSLQG
jgi:AraC-like DNA-binding protein